MSVVPPSACPLCGSRELSLAFRYDEPPEGETRFELPAGTAYERELWRCEGCGHFVAAHELDLNALYEGGYVDATYAGERLHETYERIMALPPERSDNTGRVARVIEHWEGLGRDAERTLLDVGSGLGVFPARMQEEGWRCTALDPDPRACEHARERIGVEAVCADFMTAEGLGEFELVSFNKVLEHIRDPVEMLARARHFMREGGTVYIEVPDGELAAADGPGREEFFIEHYHAFSLDSTCLLAERAGFEVGAVERLREPSDKYTLYAFLR